MLAIDIDAESGGHTVLDYTANGEKYDCSGLSCISCLMDATDVHICAALEMCATLVWFTLVHCQFTLCRRFCRTVTKRRDGRLADTSRN